MTVRLDRDAGAIVSLLRALAADGGVDADMRANADWWARNTHKRMNRRDTQTLSWLLAEAGNRSSTPRKLKRVARYWGGSLAARL